MPGRTNGTACNRCKEIAMSQQKYLFIYRNSASASQEQPSPQQMQAMMDAWNGWKNQFKANIVDVGDGLKTTGKVLRDHRGRPGLPLHPPARLQYRDPGDEGVLRQRRGLQTCRVARVRSRPSWSSITSGVSTLAWSPS
jgi:hypothetical protein